MVPPPLTFSTTKLDQVAPGQKTQVVAEIKPAKDAISGDYALLNRGRANQILYATEVESEAADACFVEADAGIVMDRGAGPGLGDEVGGVDRGMRAADDDGAVGFRRQLGHARDDQDGDGHGDIISPMRL